MALKEAASTHVAAGLAVDLVAVLAAVTDGQPRVMTIRDGAALPSGPFELDPVARGTPMCMRSRFIQRAGMIKQLIS
jgi:hypothetical protein